MILNVRSKTPIKCKAAKSIRIPNAYSIEVKSNEIADLFFCESDDYKTIFYTKNNAINFIRMHNEDYRYKVKIVELFDYKNWTCNLLSIDRKKYGLIKPAVSPEMFVRAPNGDLYCMIDYAYYFVDDGKRKDRNNHRILIIHNLTKGQALFHYMTSNEFPVSEKSGEAIFPFFFSTPPLYNSFIIVMRIDIHDSLRYGAIYLVNLLENNVEEITFDIRGYMESLIAAKMNEYIKERYNIDGEFDPKKYYREFYGFDVDDVLNTKRITVETWTYDSNLIRHQDGTPVYSACEATFDLRLKSTVLGNKYKWEYDIDRAIIFSARIENNEIHVLLACARFVTGFDESTYVSEPEYILLDKKYPIHIINQFDISKSQLYSITSFFGNYLFKDGDVYKLHNNIYKNEGIPYSTSGRNGVYLIQQCSKCDKVLAIIPPKYIHKNNERYLEVGEKIVNFDDINKIANMYSKHNNHGIIVDINEHAQVTDIRTTLEKLKQHVIQFLHDKKIECRKLHYDYYFSEKTGELYMFAIVHVTLYKIIRFVIVKHKISQPIDQIMTILLSDPYELETYEENVWEDEEVAVGKEITTINRYKLLSDIIKNYSLLNKMIKDGTNKKNKYMYFIDFVNHFFEMTFNEENNRSCYLYDEELIVEQYVSFSNIVVEFKDIVYNRQSTIRSGNLNRYHRTVIEADTAVKRYENVLLHMIDNERYYFEYDFLTVISEMDVVKLIKLRVYD
jgi:hypothetical protein